ncbi:hypothetical protein ACFCY8_11265 [Streptomyces noursei]|uniref:hypothetical protein n=1 Tax=Streptomyces noursei TaxID=1971 RepID=UPI0035E1C563
MNIHGDMRRVMRQYGLTEPMVRAIYSGAGDAIIDCNWRTEAALVERGLMHRVNSNLTPKGQRVLAALKAAEGAEGVVEPAAVDTPAPKVVEGVIVSHAGVTKGFLPKHCDDLDVRAAIAALGNLKLAELTDDFDPKEGADVRGFLVEPRGGGRVAVYWVFAGLLRDHNDKPFRVELQIAADRLREAGWRVEPTTRSSLCAFAHRPVPVDPVPESEWTQFPVQVKVGDLIEAKTATRNAEPSTVRVRVDREPWLINRDSAAISDGAGLNSVFTDTIRVIDETLAAPAPMSEAFERNIAAANSVLADVDFGEDEPPAPALQILRDDVVYGIQWRKDDGKWKGHVTTAVPSSRAEVDAYVADVQALAAPGIEVRAVEHRVTHTALPMPGEAKSSDADHGPVDARTLRSGCRVDLYGAERLIWKAEYLHAGNYLRIHTVPPAGEDPSYFGFTMTPTEQVELISRGPAVDVTGDPVDHAG